MRSAVEHRTKVSGWGTDICFSNAAQPWSDRLHPTRGEIEVMRKLMRVTLLIVLLTPPATLRAEHPFVMDGVLKAGMAIPQGALVVGITDADREFSLPRVGYVLAAEVRVGIRNSPFVLNVLGSMASFSNDGVDITGPTMGPEKIVVSTSIRVLSLGMGVQYCPLEVGLLKPYLGANGELSFFSGRLQNEAYPQEPPFDMNIAIRFGLSLAIGTEIGISGFPFLFDLQAKYLMANLVGKQYKDMSSGYELADGTPPFPGKMKNINYTTVTLGLVFSLF